VGGSVRAVEVKGLHYSYPTGVEALRGISMRMEEGESVALVGPNGGGKSTLLLHLNGILRAQAGSVKIFGTEVSDESLGGIRSAVGLLVQNPDDQLFSPTVFDDVAFGPVNTGLQRGEVEERVVEALGKVGLGGKFCDRVSHNLSFGEKKRVAMATILSMNPKILALDEPTLGLDPWFRKDFVKLLRRLSREHTMVVATHDLKLARVWNRVLFMERGLLEPFISHQV
jgi:cobalt/nickel transport system ATP-binding protein